MALQERLRDCFLLVIENAVASVGVCKAVHLRPVSKAFDAAVLYALCVSQVADYDDPVIEGLRARIPLSLKARIFLTRSRNPLATKTSGLLAGIANINNALDALATPDPAAGDVDDARPQRHLLVAEAVASMFPDLPINHSTASHPLPDGLAAGQNLLCAAIVIGDIALVRSLLDCSDPALRMVDVNEEAPCFGRPLQVAATWGRSDILELLLERGAEANGGVSDSAWKPWPFEAAMGPTYSFVLRNPRNSALRGAALGGHEDIVRRLLEPQHRMLTDTVEYFRCIVEAARGGHLVVMELLIEQLDKKLMEYPGLCQSIMLEACRHGQENVVRYLLDSGFDANSTKGQADFRRSYKGTYGALATAAAQGNLRLVRLLLDRGADPLRVDMGASQVPILEVARTGHDEVLDLLLECGGLPPDVTLGDLVAEAAAHGEERLVRMLVARNPGILDTKGHEICELAAKPDCTLGEALLWAAREDGNSMLTNLLVKDFGVTLNDW